MSITLLAHPSCPPPWPAVLLVLCRLASGDSEGGLVVWSVLALSVVMRLEDSFSVREDKHLRELRERR